MPTKNMRSAIQVPLDFCKDPTLLDREVAISKEGGFAAYAGLGPLAKGHLILVPRFQANSFAQATHFRKAHDDYEQIARELVDFLGEEFQSNVIRYEHGTSRSIKAKHARMHFLPINPNLRESLAKRLISFHEVKGLSLARSAEQGLQDYLYAHDGTTEWLGLWEDWRDHPGSQYIRGCLVTHNHLSEPWDWTMNPQLEEVVEMAATLREKFAKFVNRPYVASKENPAELFKRNYWTY